MDKKKQKVCEFIKKSCDDLQKTSQTFQDIYNAIVNRNPSGKAYIYFDESDKQISSTYENFKDATFKTASKISRLINTAPGSVVGIKLKNSPRWPTIFWALLMAGHIPLLIDARLPKENTNNLLKQAGAQALIANDEETFICRSYRLNEIYNEEPDYSFRPDWANHMIFCSSGTTGDAKLMVYNGKNMVAQICAAHNMGEITSDIIYPGKTRILAMLPYHHIFGFIAVLLWYSFFGKTIVYPSSMATNDLIFAIKNAKCTHVYSVPLFWDGVAQKVSRTVSTIGKRKADVFEKMIAFNTNKITKKEAGLGGSKHIANIFKQRILGKSPKYCISGGGFLSPRTQNLINGLGYPLYNGYGMTEIGIVSVELSPSIEQRLKSSIGKPLHGIEFRIGEDRNNGNVEQTTGQLYVRSRICHSKEIIGGVLKSVDYSKEFFPTGDIASKDDQGYYFIKGRIKDTIILSNGENVYPDEIETYFKDIKNLNNVVCLGARLKGETEEKIVLVCEVDNSVTKEEVEKIYADIKSINETLPNEKKIQEILVDKKPLPMSGSMKVKRFMIKEAIQKGSDEFINFEKKEEKIISFDGYPQEDVEKTMAKVTKIFSKILMLPEFKIAPNAIWTTDLGGDSMSYIEMVQTLDKAFKIEIVEDKYGVLGTVNDFTKEILVLKYGEKTGKSNSKATK